jgi:hypothetical protein
MDFVVNALFKTLLNIIIESIWGLAAAASAGVVAALQASLAVVMVLIGILL